MQLRAAAAAGSMLAASIASAGTTSQTIDFDYDPTEGVINPLIDRFDTLGGTRELTGIRFDFDHSFRFDFFAESSGPTAVAEGDWLFEGGFISIMQLGLTQEEEEEDAPGPPFFGPGAFFTPTVSAALSATDGFDPLDGMGSDTYRETFTDAYSTSLAFDPVTEASVYDALTGTGQLETVYGGFIELFFQWINDPGWPQDPNPINPFDPGGPVIQAGFEDARHNGSFTVTYDFRVVPAPAAIAPLALGGLMMRRRR